MLPYSLFRRLTNLVVVNILARQKPQRKDMAVLVKRLTECARLIVNVVHVHVKVGQSSFESARDNNITVSNTNVHHSNAYHIQNFILLFICLYLKKGLYKEETGALPHPVI